MRKREGGGNMFRMDQRRSETGKAEDGLEQLAHSLIASRVLGMALPDSGQKFNGWLPS